MERIVKNRLEFIVEREKLLKPEQGGFRKAQGTTDILLRLEHRIRQAFENRNVSLVVYLDLKSAFDKVWGKGLIYKLSKYGLQGNILKWLDKYFKDRKIQVRLDGHLSSKFDISAGTPQGAVCSPFLLNLMLTDIPTYDDVEQLYMLMTLQSYAWVKI